jgi:hypothetical protein
MFNTSNSSKVATNTIRILTLIISFLILAAAVLVIATFGKASIYESCTFDNCKALNNCTIPSCVGGQCIYTPAAGCCIGEICNTTEPGIFKYETLFVKNITGKNTTNSNNSPLFIEDVMFQNSTVTFDCLISEADCPNFFKYISFDDAVKVNNLLEYNQSFVTINEIVQIRSTGLMEALEAAINLYNLNVTGNVCAPDFSACNTTIFLYGVTVSNGTVTVDIIGSTDIIIDHMTVTITTSFNVTNFIFGNSTVQAYGASGYENILFDPQREGVGIGFRNQSSVTHELDVNGTLAAVAFSFTSASLDTNELLSAFEFYTFNTTVWGPWEFNITKNFIIHVQGILVTLEFPEDFNFTAITNGTIGSLKPIPSRFRPLYNATQYLELDIVVTSDASYHGLPGVFRMNIGDGTFVIYATNPTNATTTAYTSSTMTDFIAGNPAGLKSCTVAWLISDTINLN